MAINVAVFTSANELHEYKDTTRELGRTIGRNGCRLVTGGLSKDESLMNQVFVGYCEANPKEKAIGFVPTKFYDENKKPEMMIQKIYPDLRTRQNALIDNADIFVLNFGANGSAYEFFEAYILRQVKEHLKPIIVLNINGYWDRLYDLMMQFRVCGGASHPEKYVTWLNSVDEFNRWLKEYVGESDYE